MAGIERRKENLKAFSRFRPRMRATAIVVPLRERPGIMAMPCATPNTMASGMVILSVFSLASFEV